MCFYLSVKNDPIEALDFQTSYQICDKPELWYGVGVENLQVDYINAKLAQH